MTTPDETVIREVTEGVWTFSKPFARFNLVPVGGRSTAVRLSTGEVWVLASTPLTDDTKKTLDNLGNVTWLVAPDAVHHLYLKQYKDAYPKAKLIGVADLVEKKKGEVVFDGVYGRDPEDTQYGYEREIQAKYFSGFVNRDVAFLHASSRTLIQADLIFNLPATEQYSKSKSSANIPFFGGFGPYSKTHKRFAWSAGKDKEAMKRDVAAVAAWDFTRIIPCHGDVIEENGNKAWCAAYSWYLEENP